MGKVKRPTTEKLIPHPVLVASRHKPARRLATFLTVSSPHRFMSVSIDAYCTVRTPVRPPASFAEVGRHDRHDHELASDLAVRYRDLLHQSELRSLPSLAAIAQHFLRVQRRVSLVADRWDRNLLAPWAWQVNAILVTPEGEILDPDGRRLCDRDHGLPESDAQLPFPVEARQRKAQSEMLLRNRLIDVPAEILPVVSEPEVEVRDAHAVVGRALALLVVAVRAESLRNDQPISLARLQNRLPEAWGHLSASELIFLEQSQPDPLAIEDALWNYESLLTLQWALGMHPELPFPDEFCDIAAITHTMLSIPADQWLKQTQLRNDRAILDALDLHQRLLWAAREAYRLQQPPPASIDGNIIVRRQHALNWLTSWADADWDAVDTPS